jgi:hypothetical protein
MKNGWLFILIVSSFINLKAQKDFTSTADSTRKKDEEKSWILMHVAATYSVNAGDWADRYPAYTALPLRLEYYHKNKYTLGADFSFYLGSQVNSAGIFPDMTDADGSLRDNNGYPAVIRYYMRGWSSRAYALKIIPLNYNAAKEARWSLQLGGGVGYTRHYTKFNFDLDMVPQLEEEYLGGYDRLTAGTQIFEQIRFQYLNNSLVSLSAGFEFLQGFTKHQRAYDFTTRSPQNQGYFDLGIGAFIGVIIPIKLGQTSASEEYYID